MAARGARPPAAVRALRSIALVALLTAGSPSQATRPAAVSAPRPPRSFPADLLDSLTVWHRSSRLHRVDSLATALLPVATAADDTAGLLALRLARGRTRAAFGLAAEGEPDLRAALALAVAAGDTGARLRSLRWLCVATGRQGRPAEALGAARTLEALARAAADSAHLGWAWVGRAYDHYLAGRPDSAGMLYGQAGRLLARSGQPGGAMWARNGEGLARRQLGDLAGARAAFGATARLARQVDDRLNEAMALAFAGRLELLIGDPAVAEFLLTRAADIHRRHQHHREGLLPLLDLAVAHDLAGRGVRAAALLDSVRAEATRHGLADLAIVAGNQLADRHLAAGRPAAAVALAREQLARPAPSAMAATEIRLRLARGLAARDSVAAALAVLGEVPRGGAGAWTLELKAAALAGELLLRQGRPRAALARLEAVAGAVAGEAVAGAAAGEAASGPPALPVLTALGRARQACGDPDGARTAFDRAVAAWDTLRSRPADVLWRERRSAAAGDLFAHAVSAHLDGPASWPPPARLAAAFALLQRYKARALGERMRGPARWSAAGEPVPATAPEVTLAGVQAILGVGEVLLDAVAGPDGGVLFAVTTDTALAVRLPAPARSARSRLEAALTSPHLADAAAAARLARARLGPLPPALTRRLDVARRLFWCPDGDLHGLPLALLWPEAEVARLPASGFLVPLRAASARPAAPPRAGAPALLVLDGTADPGRRLPGAAAETAWLAASIRGTRRGRGTAGPPGDAWRRAGVLHLAAHVELTPRQPWRSAAVLGDGTRLVAADVAHAPVAAELVVLGGCSTAGREVVGGEGLLGLGSAFLAAGAPVVLATLWDVDDHAAALMTADVYTALAAGETVGAAMAAARRARRADPATAAPCHWAGFVVLGDGARTVAVAPRRPVWPVVALLLVAGALLVGAVARDGRGRPRTPDV